MMRLWRWVRELAIGDPVIDDAIRRNRARARPAMAVVDAGRVEALGRRRRVEVARAYRRTRRRAERASGEE